MLIRAGERVAQEQKRLAPVSPDGSHGRPSGYMRSRVGFELGRVERDLCVDIGTDATTPDGHSYPVDVELGTRAHVIESKGDYPLRDKHGNVYGRKVNHPGTAAQPFLRPSLDVLRGEI
jgi:hypothetical protein